jgi:circadian clock protein KaiB
MNPTSKKRQFENSLKAAKDDKYVLRLYVAGATIKATQAILKIKEFCEAHLKGRYELEVIDIYQQPVLARGEQIIATPTLIKKLPAPLRRFIGDMADVNRILVGLDLLRQEENTRQHQEDQKETVEHDK